MKIVFKTCDLTIEGRLNNSQTALKIYEKLPFEAKLNTWGEEIYFKIPVRLKPEDTTEEVEIGDIAYWPEGSCLCIFFGRTPLSKTNKPIPASEVSIIGKITTQIAILKNIKAGEKIVVNRG